MNTNNTMLGINNPLNQELPVPGSANASSSTAPVKQGNCQKGEDDCHNKSKSFDSILQEHAPPEEDNLTSISQNTDSGDEEIIDTQMNNHASEDNDLGERAVQHNTASTETEHSDSNDLFLASNSVNRIDSEFDTSSDLITQIDKSISPTELAEGELSVEQPGPLSKAIDVLDTVKDAISKATGNSVNINGGPQNLAEASNLAATTVDHRQAVVKGQENVLPGESELSHNTGEKISNKPGPLPVNINAINQDTVIQNNLMSTAAKPEQLTVDSKENIQSTANLSPLAGSLAIPSEAVLQRSPIAPSSNQLVDTPSENFQWSGKISPSNGKSLPESLPFYSSNEAAIEVKPALASNSLATTPSSISDLVNKSLSFSQQLNNVEITPPLSANSSSQLTDSISAITTNIQPGGSLPHTAYLDKTVESRPQLPAFPIQTPVTSNEWNAQVGNRVTWLGKMNISNAELLLHPAELGSIEVKISTENDQTKVSFISNNAVTREIIETSLPRLRELLSEGGLQLEHSDVSAQSQETEKDRAQQSNKQQIEGDSSESVHLADNALPTMRSIHLGQINHYV